MSLTVLGTIRGPLKNYLSWIVAEIKDCKDTTRIAREEMSGQVSWRESGKERLKSAGIYCGV